MRIGELSRRTGASPRSLRHYERSGLLTAGRAANGYRDYGPEAVGRVRTIRTLLDHGFGLRDARGILPCLEGRPAGAPPCAAALESYARRLRALDRRITDLSAVRDRARAGLVALRRAAR